MSHLTRLESRLRRFFFAPADVESVALFRVALGALMLAWCVTLYPNWARDYAADGMISLGDPLGRSPGAHWYSVVDLLDGRVPIEAWWWIVTAATIAFTIGLKSRWMAALLLVLHTSLLHRNLWASNAEQGLWRMLLFYAMFMPLGAAWAVTKDGAGRAHDHPIWPVRMAQLHLCLIYLVSSPYKWFSDEAWRHGDALYYVLINGTWSRWPWPEWLYHWPVAAGATYGSLLVEASFPFLVWMPALRPYVALTIVGFQVMLAVVLNHISFFSLATACGLLLFCRSGDWETIRADVAALAARWSALVGSRPSSAPAP
jgi:hypothetical protein